LTRINRNNIQLGDSFVVSIEDCGQKAKIQAALEKEQEIVFNAEQKAAEIVEQANLQAQQIIEMAEQEALSRVDEITQQAHNEGFEAGRQEGYANITQELQDKIIAVNDFAYSNFDIKNNIIKSAHLDIIRLVVEIAQKVCSSALELDDNILKELTLQAIKSLKNKEDIIIIVHPEMAQKIYAISDEFKEQIPQLSSIKIVEDSSVSPDGTIVESPMSRVDCRVKSQINEIADRLMGKLDSTPFEEREKGERETGNGERNEANSEQQIANGDLSLREGSEATDEAIQIDEADENSRLGFLPQQQEAVETFTEEIIATVEELPIDIAQEMDISAEEQVGEDEFVDLINQDIQVRTDNVQS
jgi:flagellar assembly protein FliH